MAPTDALTVADIDLENVSPEDLEMWIRQSEPAPEPGPYKNDRVTVITAGQGDEGMPQVMQALKSAGWSYIYRIENGKREVTNNNLLLTNLRKTLNGKPVFTTHAPGAPGSPIKERLADLAPKHLCLLHTDHPNRSYLDEIGLQGQTCRKRNLASPFQVERHMSTKHKMELATIERDKVTKKDQRAEDRADRTERFQREVMGEGIPSRIIEPTEPVEKLFTMECPECGEEWEYDSKNRIKGYPALRRHRKQEHGVVAQRKPKAAVEDTDD